jgi:Carboxypeptidase regulatory-like domain/TonB dependent receptor-like, beta-barrel/TonB-dependent Receptor Plug Domain
MTKFSRFTLLSLAIVGLLVPSFGFAQTSANTGAIVGTVTDSSGGVLPGVTVTVTGPNLQGSRTAVTDAKGEYVIPILPPGTYKAEYSLTGLKSVVQNGIVVNATVSSKQDAKMAVGVSETMTVTASQIVVDPTQTTTQQAFKEEHLKYAAIGQQGRSYQSVLAQAAGSAGPNASTGAGGGGNPQVFGSNQGQNQWRFDGLNATDPVTHTFGTNFAFDAIQEVSVQTAGYEAEYGKATGGVVNVITKSGGNNFSGTADVRLSNQHMISKGHKHQEANASLLAFDRSTQVFKNWGPQATIGGPIQQDKIWFFVSGQRLHNHIQPPNTQGFAPGDRQFIGWNTFSKLTATLTPNQTWGLKYTYNPALIPFAQQSSFVKPEADRDQYQTTRAYNATWDAVLSSQWIASVQAGRWLEFLKSSPHSGDLTTTGVIDQATGVSSVNFTNFQESDRDRDELIASTSYFLKGAGTHQIKVGTDIDKSVFKRVNYTTGTPTDPAMCGTSYIISTGQTVGTGQPGTLPCGSILRPVNGAVNRQDVSTQIPQLDFKSNARTFYAQDEWKPMDRLTAKFGLRYDTQAFKRDDGSNAKTLTKFQPRLGFAYDVFNNANTVIHGHWGRFMDDNALTLSSYLASAAPVTDIYLWSASQNRWNLAAISGSFATGNGLDPSLEPTYADETNIGFTQRLTRDSSLDITGVWKQTHDIFEDSCQNTTCQGVLVNGAPVVNTAFWMTNNPGGLDDVLKQKYTGVITKYEWHPTWGNILASYTWSKSLGSIEYTQNAGADFDVFPVNFTNRYGYLSDDARHRVKVDGYLKVPGQIIVGANWYWDSGTPYNVTVSCSSTTTNATLRAICPVYPAGTVNSAGQDLSKTIETGTFFAEQRGSRRLSHFKQLDLEVRKNFTLANQTFSIIGSVFNVMNKETVIGRNGNLVAAGNAFTTSTSWQRPRRYEIGARYEF